MTVPTMLQRLAYAIFFCTLAGGVTTLVREIEARFKLPSNFFYPALGVVQEPLALFDGHRIKKAYIDVIRHTGAQSTLDLAAFVLTEPSITQELIAAHKRGVPVKVLVDKNYAFGEYSQVQKLINMGVQVYTSLSAKMHNKYLVCKHQDGSGFVITGSYNPTTSASTCNDENVVVHKNAGPLIAAYQEQFHALLKNACLAGQV